MFLLSPLTIFFSPLAQASELFGLGYYYDYYPAVCLVNPRWDETVIAHSDYASLSSAFICWFSSSSRHSRDDVQCISNVLDGWPDPSRAAEQQARELQTCFSGSSHCLIPFFLHFWRAEGFPPFYLVVVVVVGRPVRRDEGNEARMVKKISSDKIEEWDKERRNSEIRRLHHRHLLKRTRPMPIITRKSADAHQLSTRI